MGFAFLWLETLATALLLVSIVISFTKQIKKWPTLGPILIALLLGLLGISATAFSGILFFKNIHPKWLFPYTLSWTLIFFVTSILLIRWRRSPIGAPGAAAWSRLKLLGGLLIAIVLQWNTITALDNAAKLELVADQTRIMTRAKTILPSPPIREQEASEIYERAFQEMGKIPEWIGNSTTNPIFDPDFDPLSEQAQSLLVEKKKAIRLIKEATRKPYLYHPLVLTFDIEFPIFYKFKNGSELLALEARSFAKRGNMLEALKNISCINQIAKHLNQTPTLVNVLMASAIHTKSKKSLEIILAEKHGDSKVTVPLPVKTDQHLLDAFRAAMVYEESFSAFGTADHFVKSDPIDENESIDDFESFYEYYQWKFFVSMLYRIFLSHEDIVSREQYWKELHDFFKKPYYETKITSEEWQEQIQKNIEFGFIMSENDSSFISYYKRVTEQQTQFLLAQLGLATAAYYSHHGKYPNTLEALAPKYITEIPVDPFSGSPLKMIPSESGLILYGVGPNLKDDKGSSFESETKEGDIAFYLGSSFKAYRHKPAI